MIVEVQWCKVTRWRVFGKI